MKIKSNLADHDYRDLDHARDRLGHLHLARLLDRPGLFRHAVPGHQSALVVRLAPVGQVLLSVLDNVKQISLVRQTWWPL